MGMVMMTVRSDSPPTLDHLRRQFDLSPQDVDEQFGVIEVDPDDRLYTFMVDENKARRLANRGELSVNGPYSNPPISTFGPPRR